MPLSPARARFFESQGVAVLVLEGDRLRADGDRARALLGASSAEVAPGS
jgi:hypothetical protein